MARADIHVFGSISGYGTVAASPGVRPDETRELEHFQFGEISTSEAIAQLGSRPTMTVRPLASGRVAISRMIPAGADDAGRPTIEVVTLLVDARGAEAVLPALDRLLSDVGFWREARERSRSGVELPEGAIPSANPRDSALLRILDAWLLATRSGSVAVLPESAIPDLLRFVATLDPADRVGCRWGVGINSLSAPVDICTMMSGASTHGARAVVRPATADRWYVQETEVARASAADGAATWTATARLVGRATATAVVGGLGDPTDAFASGSPRSEIDERRKRVMLISMLAAVCATGLLATATALFLSGPSAKRSELADVTERDGVEPSGTLATPPPLEGTQRSGFGGSLAGVPVGELESSAVAVVSERAEGPASEPERPDAQSTSSTSPDPASSPPPTQVPAMVAWYPDKDRDGVGVSEGKIELPPGTPPPAGSWADKDGDECPECGGKLKLEKCGCIDLAIEAIDADGDGTADCEQDDDCDGVPNFQELGSDWDPNSRLRPLLKELRVAREELGISKSMLKEIEVKPSRESLPDFVDRVCQASAGVAEGMRLTCSNLKTLQQEEMQALKDGSGFPFAKRILVGPKGNDKFNCQVLIAWEGVVGELREIAKELQRIRGELERVALRHARPGSNQKNDFTSFDAKARVENGWEKFRSAIGEFERFTKLSDIEDEQGFINRVKGEETKRKRGDDSP